MRVPIALLALSPFFAALSPLSAQRLKVGAEQKIGDGGKPNETSPVSRLGSGLSFKPLPCSSAPHLLRTQQV
jgi:hypothetical protein